MAKQKYKGRRNDYFEHMAIEVPKEMKRAIEKYGYAIGQNKSEVVRQAITTFLQEQYFPQSINNIYNLNREPEAK